ncbi:MAG TPA: Uma2 family endonuclease [Tepidisphaeraceae bacterium]|nr:Uma2 family endonuclease [Tepidisphaeraceae bacterium]
MSAIFRSHPLRHAPLELQTGDRMRREEFHRVYEQTQEDFKAELIGGIVYVASPLRIGHGKPHLLLGSAFAAYESATAGVDTSDNTTVLLGDDSEPQPDLYLRILPEYGGQSRTAPDDYVSGPPELIAEVALSSRSIDLHGKRDDYTRHGVLEYLVLSPAEPRMYWFDLRNGQELPAPADGVYKMRAFPGLWIDSAALFAKDYAKLMATLQQGLATAEHAAFVKRLGSSRDQ